MRLTSRAKLLVGLILGLAFSAILFRDLFFALAFIAIAILVLSELAWMTVILWRPGRYFWLTTEATSKPESKTQGEILSGVVLIGRLQSQILYLFKRPRGKLSLTSELPYLKLEPTEFGPASGVTKIHARFQSPFAGTYRLNGISANLCGPLKLFDASFKLMAPINYSVYAKIYEVALTSAKILQKTGIGEIPTSFPGIGTEFYDLREYQAGDDIRSINWKASARLGDLIVIDRAKEIGSRYFLVLDSKALNDFDRDRLASAFLQIANNLAILGSSFGFLIHNGKKVIAFQGIDRPQVSLNLALALSLEVAGVSPSELIEELSAIPSKEMKLTADKLSEDGLSLLAELERMGRTRLRKTLESGAFEKILDVVAENQSEQLSIVYISGLIGSTAPVIECASQLQVRHTIEFIVVDPTSPWVVAQDENLAGVLYENHLRNLKVLENAGVLYQVGEPLKIAERLFV